MSQSGIIRQGDNVYLNENQVGVVVETKIVTTEKGEL